MIANKTNLLRILPSNLSKTLIKSSYNAFFFFSNEARLIVALKSSVLIARECCANINLRDNCSI